MTYRELAVKIKEYLHEHPGAIFLDIMDYVENELVETVYGSTPVTFPGKPNVFLWEELSPRLAYAIDKILAEGEYIVRPCDSRIYIINGKVLSYPAVADVEQAGADKKVWLPVAFYSNT